MSNQKNDITAAASGAVIGSTGAITAVSTLGVSGLAATGITSGLAAVGSLVGGGMLAGLAVTAAAPLAGGATVYGIYKWISED